MLPIADIIVDADNRLRPFSEAGVESLIASIEEIGVMKDPIHVRRQGRGEGVRLTLMAGGHRLEAAKRLGWTEIPARVWADITDNDAKFIEIDDNLAGKALDPLDQAEFLAERKRVYEKAHPETKRGGDRKSRAYENQTANLAVSSFVKATAEATGLSERNIYRRVSVGEKLSKADINALRAAETPIKATDLEALAKIEEPIMRADVVGRLAAGKVKSVAEAMDILQPKAAAPVKDPTEEAFKSLSKAWMRAPMAVKRRFVEDLRGDLTAILSDQTELKEV
ncbi:ParB N-terminal domain-containing protein [Aliiroseovarius crassostreae]|nr:ParB N-terminal domain-containing protein [Aliiroseovarius crassostreae]